MPRCAAAGCSLRRTHGVRSCARNADEVWNLDNLIKPTLDAMDGVFGAQEWSGYPQAADDRVDRIEAAKRLPSADEVPGATFDIWLIDSD
ncbi:MAG: hypothetical protein J2P17_26940 [Mycobacterium sp.]|nr:hypothetical protein [Mycobacterium sp.]